MYVLLYANLQFSACAAATSIAECDTCTRDGSDVDCDSCTDGNVLNAAGDACDSMNLYLLYKLLYMFFFSK